MVATDTSISCARVFRDGQAWPRLLAYRLSTANSRTAFGETSENSTYSGTMAK